MKRTRKTERKTQARNFHKELKFLEKFEGHLHSRLLTHSESLREYDGEAPTKELVTLVHLSFQYTAILKRRVFLYQDITNTTFTEVLSAIKGLDHKGSKKAMELKRKIKALQREHALVVRRSEEMERISNGVDAIIERRANAIYKKALANAK